MYLPNYKDTKKSHISNLEEYFKKYSHSIQSPNEFWDNIANRLDWNEKWKITSENDFSKAKINWYKEGKINVSYNCLDRHVKSGNGNKTAIIWEGNNPNEDKSYTYSQLLIEVCKFSNVLKSNGIMKGDRVCIYMQMIPELAIAMLACARIGAIHSIVFGAFSPNSLRNRMNDSKCKMLITQDTGVRGKKHDIPMKSNANIALTETPSIEKVIVVKRTNHKIDIQSKRDIWWHESMKDSPTSCEPEIMDSEDPLFILYTSGSTGKPKGVLHTTGGYLVYASYTHEMIFDYQPNDIYWCTADIGWITGHSYIIYGPLSNKATTIMFEGVPNYPDHGRFWQIIEKHKINIFYTAPTALRALMREGNENVKKWDRTSLKLLGTVG
ncbi:MAG: AMP-binding protein, partial [Candidatus Neomarinimicrobiota bacterium]|nr:AMP-binding protein [Candidatus Neomarinimicrobiota bacterium]